MELWLLVSDTKFKSSSIVSLSRRLKKRSRKLASVAQVRIHLPGSYTRFSANKKNSQTKSKRARKSSDLRFPSLN